MKKNDVKYDVFGIGNPLMDVLVQVEDHNLLEVNLEKGSMRLIDDKDLDSIHSHMDKHKPELAPGGSVANTLVGISQLGGNVAFCGRIGNDDHGAMYEEKLINHGVSCRLIKSDGLTGRALTFITPDSQRTFATHLGVACTLDKEDIIEKDIKESKVVHLTGYQLEDPTLRNTALYVMGLAKKHESLISIDLADPKLVERNREDLVNITKTYADIIFANEEEASAFTCQEGENAALELSKLTGIAVLKLGKKGSIIMKGEEKIIIDPVKANAVDTTGAGYLYAAGFLHSFTQEHSLNVAGKIASLIAAKVVERVGARIDELPHDEIKQIIQNG